MEEIKSMLVKLCEGQERLEQNQNEMRQEFTEGLDGLRQEMLDGLVNVRQEAGKALAEVREELLKEIRAVNQRLAVCQLENGKKVEVLFDADETRRQLLEIHDEEIPEIKSTLFNYDIRIKNLESKVIGA